MPAASPLSACLTGFPGERLREALWERYVALVEGGVPSDEVLVLVESATRSSWTDWLKGAAPHDVPEAALSVPTGAQRVHTSIAWIQNELRTWWPLVEEALCELGLPVQAPYAAPVITPIDLSQHLLGQFCSPLCDEMGSLVRGAHSPARMQRVQVLDALARSIEQGVSLKTSEPTTSWPELRALVNADGQPAAAPCLALASEVARRLEAGFSEGQLTRRFAPQVAACVALYLDGMLRRRLLDYALSLELFAACLWPQERYQAHFKAHTRHVLVENLDEMPPRLLTLFAQFQAESGNLFVSLKEDAGASPETESPYRGGLREYLGADAQGAWELASTLPKAAPLPQAEPPLAPLGRALHEALVNREASVPRVSQERVSLRLDDYSPAEMLDSLARDLATLLKAPGGAEPDEVAIVAPALSPLLIWSLRQKLEKLGYPLYVFAGTNRLSDYRPVRLLLTLARLARPEWGVAPSRFEVIELLELVTGLNPLRLGKISHALYEDGRLAPVEDFEALDGAHEPGVYSRYSHLLSWLASQAEAPPARLAPFLQAAFTQVVAPLRGTASIGLWADDAWQREVSQVGQLIDLAARFQSVDERLAGPSDGFEGSRFMHFLRENPIAERPFFKREPHRGSIMLASASQLAEKGFAAPRENLKHLLLIDAGSERWWKPDRKELTNARILANHWPERPYAPEDEEGDMNRKLAGVLMACCLKVTERLYIYGCMADEEGRENGGELPYLLASVLEGRP